VEGVSVSEAGLRRPVSCPFEVAGPAKGVRVRSDKECEKRERTAAHMRWRSVSPAVYPRGERQQVAPASNFAGKDSVIIRASGSLSLLGRFRACPRGGAQVPPRGERGLPGSAPVRKPPRESLEQVDFSKGLGNSRWRRQRPAQQRSCQPGGLGGGARMEGARASTDGAATSTKGSGRLILRVFLAVSRVQGAHAREERSTAGAPARGCPCAYTVA